MMGHSDGASLFLMAARLAHLPRVACLKWWPDTGFVKPVYVHEIAMFDANRTFKYKVSRPGGVEETLVLKKPLWLKKMQEICGGYITFLGNEHDGSVMVVAHEDARRTEKGGINVIASRATGQPTFGVCIHIPEHLQKYV